MRFRLGSPPDEFEPDAAWQPIREPGPLLVQFYALPVLIVTTAGLILAWQLLIDLSAPPMTPQGDFGEAAILIGALFSIPAIIVVHELLHAVAQPHWGLSASTVIGVWPQRLVCYAHYSGPLSRDRFLVVFVAPFLVISLLPLLVVALVDLPQPARFVAMWCSVWNGAFACVDLLGIGFLLFQIPRRAIVQNKGWRTYWKPSQPESNSAG